MTRSSEGTVYRRGSDGRWCGKWRDINGTWRYVYAPTRTEARRKLRDALERRDAGLGATDTTLGAWLDRWLDTRTGRATSDSDRRYRLGLVPKWLRQVRLDELTPVKIQTALDEIAATPARGGKPRAPSTVAKVRTLLIQALDQAVRFQIIGTNPAALTDPPRVAAVEVVPLTETEARQLLAQVDGHRYEAAYLVAVGCGLRRGEVLGLRWQDIDLEQARAQVRQQVTTDNRSRLQIGPPKTDKSRRTVALPQVCVAALRRRRVTWLEERLRAGELWHDTDLVFGTEIGTPTYPRNLLRHLHGACEAAGIRRVSFHTLRHSAATLMLAAGVPSRTIMDVLGHSSTAMVARYQHVVDQLRDDAATAMDGVLGEVPGVTGGVNDRTPDANPGS